VEQTAMQIIAWLREKVRAAGAKGLVVGLSGGVDSACTAALAKRAMGEEVLGVLMPCDSSPEDADYAHLAAQALKIETITVDLGSVYDAFLQVLPPAGELAAANIKPRLRMAVLYYLAAANQYLVAGTGNKSESMVGYFTKYGDGGVDLEPLGELYKWQVLELARWLGVPRPIVERPPSAGLWAGQTDEGEMGITYQVLDATLAMIETGRTEGGDPAALERVRQMIARSEHKRSMPPTCPVSWDGRS
jgi:NAD+ synthase